VATGSYAGEGFGCPALDALFLAAPVASKGSLTQYAGRILRSHENKTAAEVHDYLDDRTGVLAAMLAKRAPGYTGLGFPAPRKIALTPSVSTDSSPTPQGRSGADMRTQWRTLEHWQCRRSSRSASSAPGWRAC
jgi:superfamily II DNA or RNA helicase